MLSIGSLRNLFPSILPTLRGPLYPQTPHLFKIFEKNMMLKPLGFGIPQGTRVYCLKPMTLKNHGEKNEWTIPNQLLFPSNTSRSIFKKHFTTSQGSYRGAVGLFSSCSLPVFHDKIDHHLAKRGTLSTPSPLTSKARELRRRFEEIPIEIEATRAFLNEMERLCSKYNEEGCRFNSTLMLCVEGNKGYNIVCRVTDYFLNRRLPQIHKEEKKPALTRKKVAPDFRSMNAPNELNHLIRSPGIYPKDPEHERNAPEVPEEVIAGKKIKDLFLWLFNIPCTCNPRFHPISVESDKEIISISSLRIHLDFGNGNFVVKATAESCGESHIPNS